MGVTITLCKTDAVMLSRFLDSSSEIILVHGTNSSHRNKARMCRNMSRKIQRKLAGADK